MLAENFEKLFREKNREDKKSGSGSQSKPSVEVNKVNYFTYLCIDSDDPFLLPLSNEVVGR